MKRTTRATRTRLWLAAMAARARSASAFAVLAPLTILPGIVMGPTPANAAANPNPSRITDASWWLMEQLQSLQPGSKSGGIYANKPGYHNTRSANDPSNYSVRDAEDRGGPSDKAAAYDWTFPEAQGFAGSFDAHSTAPTPPRTLAVNYSNISRFSNRLLASAKDANDPRLDGWREFFGQADNDDSVEGWDFRYHRSASSDNSHLWHIHLSEDRDKVTSLDNKRALLSVLRGETVDQWRESGSSSGVSGDFNGDNKDDIMARDAATGELWLYPGTGSFTTDAILGQPIRVGTGWGTFDLIFSGDFNRDGKSDIVGRRPSDDTLWVYPGTGSFITDQVLSAPTRIGVGWNQFSAIFSGDFNQDGKSDLVARGSGDNVLVVYPGTGALTTDAVVQPSTRVGVGWGDLGLFTSGDFNQDGKSDIVARRISDGVLLLWPGTGSFTTDRVVNPGIQVGIGWGGMNALTAGDFNQDGKSDVVVRSSADATLWMYPGTGTLTPNQILTSSKRVGIGWGGMDRIS